MYKGRFIHTVTREDVGERLGPSEHRLLFEPLGRVLAQDIGKQIWKYDGFYYVENAEQFEKRTSVKV